MHAGSAFRIRPLQTADVPAAVALANTVGFVTEPDKWRWMLELGAGYCADSERAGLLGSILLIPFGPHLASVAMMVVHQHHQRRGIGRRLMEAALGHAPYDSFTLYATEVGQKLYRPLGFVDAGETTRLEGALADDSRPTPAGLRRMTAADLHAVVELDARAQGAPRERLLASMFRDAQAAWVAGSPAGEVRGFGFASRDQDATRIGPVVAALDLDAIDLTRELARGAARVRLDTEPSEAAVHQWAVRSGLEPGIRSPRMVRGQPLGGERTAIRALAGRPFG